MRGARFQGNLPAFAIGSQSEIMLELHIEATLPVRRWAILRDPVEANAGPTITLFAEAQDSFPCQRGRER